MGCLNQVGRQRYGAELRIKTFISRLPRQARGYLYGSNPGRAALKACLAYVLVALVLLQTFSREVLVVDYALNRVTITARFCVNKMRPALRCNGKCYFAKQLRQQQEREDQLPNPLKERLEMLPAGTVSLVPPRPATYPGAAVRYHRARAIQVPHAGLAAVFHPPQGLV